MQIHDLKVVAICLINFQDCVTKYTYSHELKTDNRQLKNKKAPLKTGLPNEIV